MKTKIKSQTVKYVYVGMEEKTAERLKTAKEKVSVKVSMSAFIEYLLSLITH